MSRLLNAEYIHDHLSKRGLSDIHKSLKDFPHFSLLEDMDKATKRIVDAIHKNEALCLVGDYDADGICASTIVVEFFKDIGYPIEFIIPDRFTDGYGVSPSVLKKVGDVSVVITVDNGIVAFEAAEACKERGIDLIITDHHTPQDTLPDCYAVVNPKRIDCPYPFKDICGAQVGFLLCASIKHSLGIDIDLSKYLDVLAIAVVADVMPLVNINRHIVRTGLKIANKQQRPFFKALLESMNKKEFAFDDFGFQIAPRINAAGRMTNARVAVEALMSDEESAYSNVDNLSEINKERKLAQTFVYANAKSYIKDQKDFVIIVGDELHEGIVGIVASKIAEDTSLPSLIMSRGEGGILKGSGRSVGSVNIYNIIGKSSHLLLKFGGHAGACGLSLKEENLEQLMRELKNTSSLLPRGQFKDDSGSLGELLPSDVSVEMVKMLEEFAPYGEKNPHPVFQCGDAKVISSKPMGQEKNHTSLTILWRGEEIRMAVFSTDFSIYNPNDNISFDYTLSLNEWQGRVSAQMMPSNICVI